MTYFVVCIVHSSFKLLFVAVRNIANGHKNRIKMLYIANLSILIKQKYCLKSQFQAFFKIILNINYDS